MIAVVGEALVDLVIGEDASVVAALGGAPFNVARACGRLGAPVTFVGAISDDRFGRALLRRLEDDRVDIDDVEQVHAPTTLAAAELDARGAAHYRFYLAGTSAPALTTTAPPFGADVLVTGGLALVLEPMAASVVAMVGAVGPGVLVVLDVNCRPRVIEARDRYLARVEAVLRRADVVKVSDEDLAFLFPDDAAVDAARIVLGRGPSVVLLTAGAAGVSIVTAAGATHVPAPAVDVVDTIGAGDAFTGGFTAWWASHGYGRSDLSDAAALERAVTAAARIASIACTRRGADPPWRADLPDGTW